MRSTPRPPLDEETAKVVTDLGFIRVDERVYIHRDLPEAGRLDLTAIADEHLLGQALRWIEASAAARGRRSFREAVMDALG